MLGKIEGKSRRGQQRMRWLDGITDSTDMGLSKLWEILFPEGRGAWHDAVHRVTKSQIQLSDLTTWITQTALCFLVKVLSLGHLKFYIKTENAPSKSLSCLVFWLKCLDCSPLCVFLNKSSLHIRRLFKMTYI